MKSPLTFTMALWLKNAAGSGDTLAPIDAVRRAVPYELAKDLYLPPAFFRAVQSVGESNARVLEAVSR